jgi:Domain of unknown function (DUF3597)
MPEHPAAQPHRRLPSRSRVRRARKTQDQRAVVLRRAVATAASASSLAEGSKGVDVTAVLDGLAAKNQQKLDWRHSIVDMMKLLGIDSGLSARKELAGELHYSGDTSDSASMNIWLHKEVMQKFAENGGKMPDELRH